jgi:hypothetical protein
MQNDKLRFTVISLWGDIPAHLTRMQEIINNLALVEPGEFDDSQAGGPKRSKS